MADVYVYVYAEVSLWTFFFFDLNFDVQYSLFIVPD